MKSGYKQALILVPLVAYAASASSAWFATAMFWTLVLVFALGDR